MQVKIKDSTFAGFTGEMVDPAYRVSGETVALVLVTHGPDGHAVRNPSKHYFQPDQVEEWHPAMKGGGTLPAHLAHLAQHGKPSPFGMDTCCVCDAPATCAEQRDGELLPSCDACAATMSHHFPDAEFWSYAPPTGAGSEAWADMGGTF